MEKQQRKIFDCLKGFQKNLQRFKHNTYISMKKLEEVKKFLEVKELSKLEEATVQGGSAGKQRQQQKNADDGTVGGPVQN